MNFILDNLYMAAEMFILIVCIAWFVDFTQNNRR